MKDEKAVELVAFVACCTAAAASAFFLASAVGLAHPLWACIFALIASQGSLATAWPAMGGRVIGTMIGVFVAIAVNLAGSRLALDSASQMILDVAICAVIVWGRPAIQICLWTPPIILVTAAPGESIITVGFARGCEVILGIIIGGLLSIAAEKLTGWVRS